MDKFTLTVTISEDGETVAGLVSGVAGKRCSNIAGLLDSIGSELEHRHTEDYDKPEPVSYGIPTVDTLKLGGWR